MTRTAFASSGAIGAAERERERDPTGSKRPRENPRFLLAGECVPLRAGERVRVYASRGPYACIYPRDTIAPCKWTHQKVLSK